MIYSITVVLARIVDCLPFARLACWNIVKRNDTGNPFSSVSKDRNRIGWIAWDIIDHTSDSFDNLS